MITIDDFNRWYDKKRLCRAPGCHNAPKWPRREYCSDVCHDVFIKFYLQHYVWDVAKDRVLTRDKFTCVVCGYCDKTIHKSRYTGGDYNVYGRDNLEVDHIIARSIMQHIHYIRYYLPTKLKYKRRKKWMINYWKNLLQQTNALWNLRTLCKQCHHKKTKSDIRKLKLLRKHSGIKELFFFPVKNRHMFPRSELSPWDIFDNNYKVTSFYYMKEYWQDKTSVEFDNEAARYFYELKYVYSNKQPNNYFGYREADEYLSFCIFMDVIENGRITQFKYLKQEEPTLFNYI